MKKNIDWKSWFRFLFKNLLWNLFFEQFLSFGELFIYLTSTLKNILRSISVSPFLRLNSNFRDSHFLASHSFFVQISEQLFFEQFYLCKLFHLSSSTFEGRLILTCLFEVFLKLIFLDYHLLVSGLKQIKFNNKFWATFYFL